MTAVIQTPERREVLVDARGDALRATWHPEHRTVQLSMWRDGACRATFPLSTDDAARLTIFLTAALGDAAHGSTTANVTPPNTARWRPR